MLSSSPIPMTRRPGLAPLVTALLSLAAIGVALPAAGRAQALSSLAGATAVPAVDPLLGPRTPLPKIGRAHV